MLARQLLDDAMVQADRLSPLAGVTARLHIARVLTAYSKRDARALLLRALREMEHLALSHRDGQLVQHEAHMLTAAIAPDLIRKLPPLDERMMRHYEFPLFRAMLDHGNADAAFDLLIQFDHAAQFPHMAVPMVLQHCGIMKESSLLCAARFRLGGIVLLRKQNHSLPAARLPDSNSLTRLPAVGCFSGRRSSCGCPRTRCNNSQQERYAHSGTF